MFFQKVLRLFLAPVLLIVLLSMVAAPIYAGNSTTISINENQFSRCPMVNGSVVASYNDGWHWIPGISQLQWGKDVVYSIGNNNYIQCFSSLKQNSSYHLQSLWRTNRGTQTNWLSVSNMNSNTKQLLLQRGWMDISDGSAFGLPGGEYLAKNSTFFSF